MFSPDKKFFKQETVQENVFLPRQGVFFSNKKQLKENFLPKQANYSQRMMSTLNQLNKQRILDQFHYRTRYTKEQESVLQTWDTWTKRKRTLILDWTVMKKQ